jgi:hypothetical protein
VTCDPATLPDADFAAAFQCFHGQKVVENSLQKQAKQSFGVW